MYYTAATSIRTMWQRFAALTFALVAGTATARHPLEDVSAAYALLERVLPGSSSHFTLATADGNCGTLQPPCFSMSDAVNGTIAITGSSVSEVTAATGLYLREWCNMTIGWPRGGGSRLFTPASWPVIGAAPVYQRRVVPYSYIENVCTHSYSLVWYDWPAWSAFIDWMALSGINLNLAMTGQEEVQYKVFSQFGLDDVTIRTWFNGPAFLTWSRGQNEYGNNICGPLPRSWMTAQWDLQRQILNRTRSLGITGQLPGFQGNIPWPLAGLHNDTNVTQQGATGWMYSTDPLFGSIADVWMQTLIGDFGTDHWYQMDGYFDGGTVSDIVECLLAQSCCCACKCVTCGVTLTVLCASGVHFIFDACRHHGAACEMAASVHRSISSRLQTQFLYMNLLCLAHGRAQLQTHILRAVIKTVRRFPQSQQLKLRAQLTRIVVVSRCHRVDCRSCALAQRQ